MASPAQKEIRTMKDFLGEAEVNVFECKVCFEKYSQKQKHRPRNLPCGHVMCQDCVSSLCLPGNERLECPFCRKACRKLETSICLPVLHLLEIIGRVVPDHLEAHSSDCISNCVSKLKYSSFNLSTTFGGWGVLFNPTGIAFCKRTKSLVVAHDGKNRIARFTMNGKYMQEFGTKDNSANTIVYPVGVAITLDGFIAVTDVGDRSLKVFSQSGKCMLVVKQPFILPWGLGINPDNEVIVSDPEAGSLVLVDADFTQGCIKKSLSICFHLSHPREIAVCQTSGAVIVVEHPLQTSKYSSSTRIKILSKEMKLLRQIDSFSLSLFLPLAAHTSAVAFDQVGNILVADVNNRCVICLQKIEDCNSSKYIVASGLSYPVALAILDNGSIAVLDSGNHSVLVYSSLSVIAT
ncbi:E3 ubiquitin-protein ligase NHLRC1 [Pseudophryne corroboree]|uniref:E3 ubiquitin-protein ligase NHLRC1 n=1 Tax=Pseudophryne corroboree TaxID=495146 RepID=UPI003081BC97